MKKKLEEMSHEELWQLFPICLVPHKHEWKRWYSDEKKSILSLLPKGTVKRISHIGSTAVSGIYSKDIVDILLEVSSEDGVLKAKDTLTENGWRCMSEEEGRASLNKGYTEDGFAEKVFHLHIRLSGDCDEIHFRDYLRENRKAAKKYEALKLSLQEGFHHDRDGYTNAKSEFVNKHTGIAKSKKCRVLPVISETILLMAALQALREFCEYLIAPLLPRTVLVSRLITMCVMIALAAMVAVYAKIRRQPLSVLPERFSKPYIAAAAVVALLYIITPANYIEGFPAVLMLIYGSIVTPVYEELLFRGYIWNRCEKAMSKKFFVLILNIVFFTVWHLGYMIPQLIDGNWNAVVWKLAAGLGYGTVLGIIRCKTGNCTATILAHGVLNLFMI